jgi:hypothetical protein
MGMVKQKQINTITEKVTKFIWKCPLCNKEIKSEFEEQVDSWADSHLRSHDEGKK